MANSARENVPAPPGAPKPPKEIALLEASSYEREDVISEREKMFRACEISFRARAVTNEQKKRMKPKG